MTYNVTLEKKGELFFFSETLLDGLFDKELLLHTRSDFVQRLGLCDKCCGYMSHIISNDIDPGGYTNKYCPILFYDVIKPAWKLEWVEGFYINKKLSEGHYHKRPFSGKLEELG